MTSNARPFTVHAKPAFSVDLLISGNSVFPENRVRLEALARDQFGEVIPGKTIEWTSSDPNVAVLEGGYLRGKAVGWTTLTASAYPTSRSMTFYVSDPPPVDLVYQVATMTGAELFIRSLETGGGLRRLLPPGTLAGQPSPSPDGGRIAFVSLSENNYGHIWTVNRDGTGLQRLTTNLGGNDHPAWSPDGTRIAFRSTRASGKSDVWVMAADGSNPRNLTAGGFIPEEYNDRPAWSPDSQRIVFSRGFGIDHALYTVRPDGTDLRELVASTGFDLLEPAWSPDGQLLAFRERHKTTGVSKIGFASKEGQRVYLLADQPPDARTPVWLTNEWIAASARAHPESAVQTVALIRRTGQTVVPMGVEHGELAEPSGISR